MDLLVSEIFMFESVYGRRDAGSSNPFSPPLAQLSYKLGLCVGGLFLKRGMCELLEFSYAKMGVVMNCTRQNYSLRERPPHSRTVIPMYFVSKVKAIAFKYLLLTKPRSEKTCFQVFQPDHKQTGLYIRRWLEA